MLSANLCLKIYKYISKNHTTTAIELAEHFMVSNRTVYRYIRLLKYHGLVDTLRGIGGGVIYKGVFNEK